MSYLVIKSASNATPESYLLTSTTNGPRLAVNGSYIPLSTDMGGGSYEVKVNDGNTTYHVMRTSTSSYSQSASASATFNTTADSPDGLESITNLTRVSTSNTIYQTRASTSATLTRASTSATLTRASTSATLTRASTYETLTRASTWYTYTRASTYYTYTRESIYGYSGYTSRQDQYLIDANAKVHLTYDDDRYQIYNTGAAGYLVVANKNVNFYSRGIPAGSWYNGHGNVQVIWNDGHAGNGYLPAYDHVYITGYKYGYSTATGIITAGSPDGMYNITTLTRESIYDYATRESIYGYETRESVYGYNTRESVSGYATRESVSGYATRESVSGYGTRVSTSNTVYETRESISGYSGVSTSSSSSSESASGTCWR